jgi:hypothetical protein
MGTGLQEVSVKPLALLFLLVMAVLTLKLSRRYAPLPLLITTCYMPLGQEFIIGGLHFQFFRIVLLIGVCRVIARREMSDFVLSPIDRLFILWGIAGVVLGTFAEFTWERFVNRAGDGFNAFGAYFLFRCWIRSLEDVIQTVRVLAFLIVPMGISMLVEKFTTRNIFAVFGGVPEVTLVREGKLRCQGAFRHPILAGTYAATLFPLFIGLWFQPRIKRWIPVAGICAAMIVTVAASSSGALLALVAAVIGFGLWGMRCRMQGVRWGIVASIILLAMVMKAPVWYIPAKISDLMGGTGWHRSYLIDQAIKHFDEWWLVGTAVTAHWAPAGQVLTADPRNMDITNNYIAEGLGGGIVKLGLFIAMIVMSFKSVGRWTKVEDATTESRRMFVWSMGVALTGHCVSFLSIAYFDQIVVIWYWLLATMSMLCLLRYRAWDMFPEEEIVSEPIAPSLGTEHG